MSATLFKRTIIASTLMILVLLLIKYVSHGHNVPPNRPLSTFPRQIGEWSGEQEYFDKKIYDILGVDDSFLCNYRSPNGKMVQLYIGYYKGQHEGNIIHSPRNCIPGAGWNIVSTSYDDLAIPNSNPGKFEVVRLDLEKGGQKQIVLYWFQARGRIITSEYLQKIYLVWDSILKNRTDGSFIRLTAHVDENEAHTSKYIRSFAQELIPILEEYIPGSQFVNNKLQ